MPVMRTRYAASGVVVAGTLAVAVIGVVSCGGTSESKALQAYATAISDVVAAGKEDVTRCENADGGGAAFCERAKKHFDAVAASAAVLAGTADGGTTK